jgi:hypothetical protein
LVEAGSVTELHEESVLVDRPVHPENTDSSDVSFVLIDDEIIAYHRKGLIHRYLCYTNSHQRNIRSEVSVSW